MPDEVIAAHLKMQGGNKYDDEKLLRISALIKERCTFLTDVWPNAYFFFETPQEIDVDSIRPKWNSDKRNYFNELYTAFETSDEWNATHLENISKELAAEKNIKPGDVLMPLRIMLVGKKMGPGVFDIAGIIGKEEALKRITFTLQRL
jgi:glutamyl-tRNA synthetase